MSELDRVDECDVRGELADMSLADEEYADTPFNPGWARVTEADLVGAVLAPGVEFLYIPSLTPVLEPDEVTHPSTPDLMTILEPRKERLMIEAPKAAAQLSAAPALPARRRTTTVVHLTGVPLLDKIVGDIDKEIARLQAARAVLVAA